MGAQYFYVEEKKKNTEFREYSQKSKKLERQNQNEAFESSTSRAKG